MSSRYGAMIGTNRSLSLPSILWVLSMSQSPPPITVVIFTHNYSRYLPEVLASAVSQTLKPTRIVVSDDCSPNESLEEVQDVAP